MTHDSLAAPNTQRLVVRPTAEPGAYEVLIGDVNVGDQVSGIQVTMALGRTPEVVLSSSRPVDLLDLVGHVAIVVDDPFADAAERFLVSIDAEELERATLERLDLDTGPSGLTRTMLRQLVEWSRGA